MEQLKYRGHKEWGPAEQFGPGLRLLSSGVEEWLKFEILQDSPRPCFRENEVGLRVLIRNHLAR